MATRKISRPRSDTAPSGYRSITLNVKGPALPHSPAAAARAPAPLPFRQSGGASGVGQPLSYSRHAGHLPAQPSHEATSVLAGTTTSVVGGYADSRAIRPLPGRSRSSTMTSSSLEDSAATLSIQDRRRREGHSRSSSSVSSMNSIEVESDSHSRSLSESQRPTSFVQSSTQLPPMAQLPGTTSSSEISGTQGTTLAGRKAFTALPDQTAPRRSPGPHNPVDVSCKAFLGLESC